MEELFEAVAVSRTGLSAVTVIDSSIEPTSSRRSTTTNRWTPTSMPIRSKGRKLGSEAATR